MFDNLFNKMLDKEQMTRDTIQDTLQDLVIEYNCKPSDLSIVIEPLKVVVKNKDNKILNEKEIREHEGSNDLTIDRENKQCYFACLVFLNSLNEKGEMKKKKVREITLKEILTGQKDDG